MVTLVLFILGILYVNMLEWPIHKYILHGLGKRKGSMFNFHWSKHHKIARKNNFYDKSYHKLTWEENSNELIGFILILLLHAPICFVSTPFYLGTILAGVSYFLIHRQAHLNPKWAKRWVPWHYDHHMGKNQDANWGVILPVCDWVMRTRKHREGKAEDEWQE